MAIWYVSPTGNDSNDGTTTDDSHAWLTWGKAFQSTSVQPGDTVYFKGGVYQKNLNDGNIYYPSRSSNGTGWDITRDGTSEAWINYWAYPDETPILDCTGAYDADERLVYGIRCGNAVNYVHFKGLTIRNVEQNPAFPGDELGYNSSQVWCWRMSGRFIMENCVIHDIGGFGYELSGTSAPNYAQVINCDVYNCVDTLTLTSPGNDGYGFSNYEGGGQIIYYHCRAWGCGDYGFQAGTKSSGSSDQYVIYDGCWAFDNGRLEGVGNGFTCGWIAYTDGNIKRDYRNCIAAYNRATGWKSLDYKYPSAVYMNIYNCVGYHNGYHEDDLPSGGVYGYMIEMDNTLDTDAHELLRVMKNNISYDNEHGDVWTKGGLGLYTHEYNSWDSPNYLTIVPSDFISLGGTDNENIALLSSARQSDGSLPDLNGFLHPATNGQLVGVGIDLGLEYDGDSIEWKSIPSIGAFEDIGAPHNISIRAYVSKIGLA